MHKLSNKFQKITDTAMGYTGLFLIVLISWASERFEWLGESGIADTTSVKS